MRAWRSAVPRSARSARDSPSSWGGRRACTGPGSTTPCWRCPRAWPGCAPGRPGTGRPGTRRPGLEMRPPPPPSSVGRMSISLQYCHITVNDLEESLAFYRDALGLEVRNDVASGRFRWVTIGSTDQPDLEIVLSEPHAGRSQADGDALQELLIKGVLTQVVFRSDDLDAAFERVRAFGAEVLQEPMDQPWGPRDCAFRDPSGNMVRISQAPKA